MDAKDYLFYGFGQVVYSIALADGKVQREEADILKKKIEEGIKAHEIEYSFTSIIFQLLDKEDVFSPEESYTNGLKNMKLGGHKMTPDLKIAFLSIVKNVAQSFPPITIEESDIIKKFETDLTEVH